MPFQADRNQPDIVEALRKAGCSVVSLAHVGGGVPDLVVGRDVAGERRTYLLEVKRGKAQLNPRERKWHQRWTGHVAIVRTPEEALAAVGLAGAA